MAKSAAKLMQDARKNYKKGKYDKALESCQQALDAEPNDPSLHIFMGDIYIKMESDFDAIKKYEDAADLYESEALYNNAIAICKKIVRAKSDYDKVYFRLGRLYSEKGFTRDAINNYTKFADIKMDSEQPDIDAVLEAYKAIVDLAPENLVIRERLADLYLHVNKEDEAKEILLVLAKKYKEQGDDEKLESIEEKIADIGGAPLEMSVSADELEMPEEPEEGDLDFSTDTSELSLDNLEMTLEGEEMDFDMDVLEEDGEFTDLEVSDLGEEEGAAGLEMPDLDGEGLDLPPIDVEGFDEEIPTLEEEEDEESFDLSPIEMLAEGELEDTSEIPSMEEEIEEESEEEIELPEPEPEPEPESEEEAPDVSAADLLKDVGFSFGAGEGEEDFEEGYEIEEEMEEEPEEPDSEVGEIFTTEEEEEEEELPTEKLVEEVETIEEEPTPTEPVSPKPSKPKKKRRKPASIEEAAQMIEEDPMDWSLYVDMGKLFEIHATENNDPEALKNAAMVYQRAAEGYLNEEEYKDSFEAYQLWENLADEVGVTSEEKLAHYQKMAQMGYQSENDQWTVQAYLLMGDELLNQRNINKARSIYRGILRIDKNNTEATKKLMAIDMGEYSEEVSEPPTPPVTKPTPPPTKEAHPSPTFFEETSDQQDEYVDLASLMGLEEEEETGASRISLRSNAPDSDMESLEEILDNFKTGLADTISEEDYAAHYDLGIAYKEMGLLDEAINEFQIATKGGEQRLKAFETIGQCFLEKDQPKFAVRQLRRGIKLTGYAEEQYIGLHYYMGIAYEEIEDYEKAIKEFEEVYILNINFKDVHERLERLNEMVSSDKQSSLPKQTPPPQTTPKETKSEEPETMIISEEQMEEGLFDLGKELNMELEQEEWDPNDKEEKTSEDEKKPDKKPKKKKKKSRVSYI